MSINPITILENETIKEAAKKIFIHRFNALPIISESGRLVRILTTHDIIRAFLNLLDSTIHQTDLN